MQPFLHYSNDNAERRRRKGIPDYIFVPVVAEFPSRQAEDLAEDLSLSFVGSMSSLFPEERTSVGHMRQNCHNGASDRNKPPKLPQRSGYLEDQALISCRDKIVHSRARSLPTILTASSLTTMTMICRREKFSLCSGGSTGGSEDGMASLSSTTIIRTSSKGSSGTVDADHMDRAPRVPRRRRSLQPSSSSSDAMLVATLFHPQNAAGALFSSPVAALAA